MKSNNIKRIMAVAKAEKTMWKTVIIVEDESGTKYFCTDEWNNSFECDELDESRVKIGKTLSIRVTSRKVAEQIIGLGEITAL